MEHAAFSGAGVPWGGPGGTPRTPFRSSESRVYLRRHVLDDEREGAAPVKLAGYTLGQMFVIGFIALVFLYLAHTINNKVDIPGFDTLVNGAG